MTLEAAQHPRGEAAERRCENGPCRSGARGEFCVAMREPQRHSPLQMT